MSLQHPDSTNAFQLDASGNLVSINKASMLVIARKEHLGNNAPLSLFKQEKEGYQIQISPNPFSEELRITYSSDIPQTGNLKIINLDGKLVYQPQLMFSSESKCQIISKASLKGIYWLQILGSSINFTYKIIAE